MRFASILLLTVLVGGTGTAAPLRNGVYAVLDAAPAREQLRPGNIPHAVRVYDRKYSDADKSEPPESVALDTASFVPLVLAGPPEARKDDHGWTLLHVTLARDQVKPLENFTRAHLGGKVAIVIDDEVVTMHKVRSVIQDGKAQITRCRDNACEVLRLKLAR